MIAPLTHVAAQREAVMVSYIVTVFGERGGEYWEEVVAVWARSKRYAAMEAEHTALGRRGGVVLGTETARADGLDC